MAISLGNSLYGMCVHNTPFDKQIVTGLHLYSTMMPAVFKLKQKCHLNTYTDEKEWHNFFIVLIRQERGITPVTSVAGFFVSIHNVSAEKNSSGTVNEIKDRNLFRFLRL